MRVLLVAAIVVGITANVAKADGKYQIVSSNPAFVWIIDTETGRVRICQFNPGGKPKCGEWSDD